MTAPQRMADGLVGVTWVSWFLANVAAINQVLQFFALLIAIIASIVAIRFHWKASK